jgi:hypothetical protein
MASQPVSSGVRNFLDYWKRVAVRARRDTKLFTWDKLLTSLVLALVREVMAGEAGFRQWSEVGQAAVIVILAYAALAGVQYAWHFIATPPRLEAEFRADAAQKIAASESSSQTAEARLHAFQAAMPAVELTLRTQGDDFILVVVNTGAPANFYADLSIVEPSPEITNLSRNTFRAYWEHAQGPIARILPGLRESMILFNQLRPHPGGRASKVFLHYYNPESRRLQQVQLVPLEGWLGNSVVAVVISSDPPMASAVRKHYRVSLGGVEEVGA